MKLLKRPIAIGLSPNLQDDDVWEAWRIVIQPWKWKKGTSLSHVISWFRHRFYTNRIYLCNSARSALFVFLQSSGVGPRDEVMLQAFTCVAVPNSILWAGATPVYIDTDERYNIDPNDIKKKISKRTKAVIVQHTFGIPGKIDEIKKICDDLNILLIEDCAHSFGASYKGKLLGSWGDAAIVSFGRDKVVSSVFGGCLIVNENCKAKNLNVEKIYRTLHYPQAFWIFQQILHPVFMAMILPLYSFGLGKAMLIILQRIKLLSFPVEACEKQGCKPDIHPTRYPNALAQLLVRQLHKLDRYNDHRKTLAQKYYKELKHVSGIRLPPNVHGSIWHRFPILVDQPDEMLRISRANGIYLGNWYKNTIDPPGVDVSISKYVKGTCPNAEMQAKYVINLPTYPLLDMSMQNKVIDLIKRSRI